MSIRLTILEFSGTARLNALRGALRDFGVVVSLGAKHVLPAVAEALRAEAVPVTHATDPRSASRAVPREATTRA